MSFYTRAYSCDVKVDISSQSRSSADAVNLVTRLDASPIEATVCGVANVVKFQTHRDHGLKV